MSQHNVPHLGEHYRKRINDQIYDLRQSKQQCELARAAGFDVKALEERIDYLTRHLESVYNVYFQGRA